MEYHGGVMTDPVQEHMLIVQIWMLVIQSLALGGLIWYTWVTRGIRKSSQDQVRVSQDLIKVAMDQVEGLSKPCLTLYSGLRDRMDAIGDMRGAVGNTVARGDQGSFVLQNIGNGIALNVCYQFLRVPREEAARQHHRRYVQHILATQKVTMPEPMTAYGGDWKLHLEYQSIGGRKYKSIVTINDRVLTAFVFNPIAEE
jgi:hypothetical protein